MYSQPGLVCTDGGTEGRTEGGVDEVRPSSEEVALTVEAELNV